MDTEKRTALTPAHVWAQNKYDRNGVSFSIPLAVVHNYFRVRVSECAELCSLNQSSSPALRSISTNHCGARHGRRVSLCMNPSVTEPVVISFCCSL